MKKLIKVLLLLFTVWTSGQNGEELDVLKLKPRAAAPTNSFWSDGSLYRGTDGNIYHKVNGVWGPLSDNLGNHTATTDLNMALFNIYNIGALSVKGGIVPGSDNLYDIGTNTNKFRTIFGETIVTGASAISFQGAFGTKQITADAAGDLFWGVDEINIGEQFLPLDGSAPMTGNFGLGGNSISNANTVESQSFESTNAASAVIMNYLTEGLTGPGDFSFEPPSNASTGGLNYTISTNKWQIGANEILTTNSGYAALSGNNTFTGTNKFNSTATFKNFLQLNAINPANNIFIMYPISSLGTSTNVGGAASYIMTSPTGQFVYRGKDNPDFVLDNLGLTDRRTFGLPNRDGIFALLDDVSGVFLPLAGGDLTGPLTVNGDLRVSADGSSQANPRIMSFTDLTAGETVRFQFGDDSNAFQSGYGLATTIYGFHTIELIGDRNVTGAPAFTTASNIGVHVINTVVSSPALVVSGAAGQAADLQQWRDGSSNVLASISSSGNLIVPAEVYGAPWDENLEVPTKKDVFDKIESLGTGVSSFNTRAGAVVPVAGDYDAFYFTETESDARYVEVAGDNMAGALTVNGQITGSQFNVDNTFLRGTFPQLHLEETGSAATSNVGTGSGYSVWDAIGHTTNLFQFRNEASARWTLGLNGSTDQEGVAVINSAGVSGNALRLSGTGVGSANVSYMSLYESDGSTRQGYVGFGSGSNNHMYFYNDTTGNYIYLHETAGINSFKFYDGTGTKTVWHSGNDGLNSGLDAGLLAGKVPSTGSGVNTVAIRDAGANLVASDFLGTGSKYEGDGKEMFRFSDDWLRLNPVNEFTNGIYCGTGILRTDGELQVGASGTQFKVASTGNTTITGTLNVASNLATTFLNEFSNTNTGSGAHTRLRVETNGATAGDPYINFGVSGVHDWTIGSDNSDGDALKFNRASSGGPSSGVNVMTMTTSGNVGIGESSPSVPLHIGGSTGELFRLEDSSTTGSPLMAFYQNGTRRSFIQHANASANLKIASEHGKMSFWTGTGGTELERLTIDSGGDVGIGETSPDTPLHITSSFSELLRLESSSSTGNPFMTFNQNGTRRAFLQYNDAFDDLRLASEYGRLTFLTGTSGSEFSRMTILPTGEIGIGAATPDASAILDVQSTSKGILFPRLTTTQRNAITSPSNGLVIYNTSLSKLQARAAGAWVSLH